MSSLEKIPEIDQFDEDDEPEAEAEKAHNPPTARETGRTTEREKGAVSKKPGQKLDPSLMVINEHKRNKMVVAAIDFGTAYSGRSFLDIISYMSYIGQRVLIVVSIKAKLFFV